MLKLSCLKSLAIFLATGIVTSPAAASDCFSEITQLNVPCIQSELDGEIAKLNNLAAEVKSLADTPKDQIAVDEITGSTLKKISSLPRDQFYYRRAFQIIGFAILPLDATRDRFEMQRLANSSQFKTSQNLTSGQNNLENVDGDNYTSDVLTEQDSTGQSPNVAIDDTHSATAPEFDARRERTESDRETNSPRPNENDGFLAGLFNLLMILFYSLLILLSGLGLWKLFQIVNTGKCPQCTKRTWLRHGNREVLDRVVRYKTVNREVKDRDGKVISRYQESVPYNSELARYSMKCSSCDHTWDFEKTENR